MTRSDPERATSPIIACPSCRTFLSITSRPDGEAAVEGEDIECSACGKTFPLREELIVRRREFKKP